VPPAPIAVVEPNQGAEMGTEGTDRARKDGDLVPGTPGLPGCARHPV
jgi:hypothetical protein